MTSLTATSNKYPQFVYSLRRRSGLEHQPGREVPLPNRDLCHKVRMPMSMNLDNFPESDKQERDRITENGSKKRYFRSLFPPEPCNH